jgi:hypothetical protein
MIRFFPPRYHGQFMRKRGFAAVAIEAFLLLGACRKPDRARVKVLIGATTVVAPGARPIEDSIVVIGGASIRAVGMRKDVPVPQASDRTDLAGEWIVPAEGSRIAVDETANLIILRHAPNGTTPATPADIGARIVAGEWKMPGAR